jgi:hypothetical protein
LIIYHTTLGDKVTTWTEDGREYVVIESRPAAPEVFYSDAGRGFWVVRWVACRRCVQGAGATPDEAWAAFDTQFKRLNTVRSRLTPIFSKSLGASNV